MSSEQARRARGGECELYRTLVTNNFQGPTCRKSSGCYGATPTESIGRQLAIHRFMVGWDASLGSLLCSPSLPPCQCPFSHP